METHFIERFKDDLFVDPANPVVAEEAFGAARFSGRLVAACVLEKEHSAWKGNLPVRIESPNPEFCVYILKCPCIHYINQCVQGVMAHFLCGTLLPLSE